MKQEKKKNLYTLSFSHVRRIMRHYVIPINVTKGLARSSVKSSSHVRISRFQSYNDRKKKKKTDSAFPPTFS